MNLNKRSHCEFGIPVEEGSLSVFPLFYQLFLNFISVHSRMLLGFIGYSIISRDFLHSLFNRKQQQQQNDVIIHCTQYPSSYWLRAYR